MRTTGADKRLQSAMEYLMTYGWSILLIVIVVAALYSLGVFSGGSFAPRAQANGCRVFRPGGPGSSTNINLEGVCSGQLPEYVTQFDGASSDISTGTTGLPLGNSQRSVFAWIDPSTTASQYLIMSQGSTNNGLYYAGLWLYTGSVNFRSGSNIDTGPTSSTVSPNQWVFVGYTYSAGASNTITVYLNGVAYTGTMPYSLTTDSGALNIGQGGGNYHPFPGLISNVQVYNTSLSSAEVNALYAEGIGGAPIDLQNVVGWWPLNGDTTDYSGDYNNGVPAGISYTSTWISSYTIP